jgi:hypothetical protein
MMIFLPLMVGLVASQITLHSWNKFLLEILTSFILVEAYQSLEKVFASNSLNHPVELNKVLPTKGTDLLYLWISFILVKYVLLGPVKTAIVFGVKLVPLGSTIISKIQAARFVFIQKLG